MNIVQIGANVGNDDLTQIIGKTQPKKLILVEPMSRHNVILQQRYGWVNNLFIENLAVDVISDTVVDFFYNEQNGYEYYENLYTVPNYGIASLEKSHLIKHNLPIDGMASIKVKTININDLFNKHQLTNIDILFIDAEGHDDTIIFTIDFENFTIDRLYFENLHIKNPDVYKYLESKNYKITKKIGQNGWTDLAQQLPIHYHLL